MKYWLCSIHFSDEAQEIKYDSIQWKYHFSTWLFKFVHAEGIQINCSNLSIEQSSWNTQKILHWWTALFRLTYNLFETLTRISDYLYAFLITFHLNFYFGSSKKTSSSLFGSLHHEGFSIFLNFISNFLCICIRIAISSHKWMNGKYDTECQEFVENGIIEPQRNNKNVNFLIFLFYFNYFLP